MTGEAWPARIRAAAIQCRKDTGWNSTKIRKELHAQFGVWVPQPTVYRWVRSGQKSEAAKLLDRLVRNAAPGLTRARIAQRMRSGWTPREAALIPADVKQMRKLT